MSAQAVPGAPSGQVDPRSSRRAALSVALGNALEFYDFTLYAYFVVLIGQAFFPTERQGLSLLLALSGYSIGFVVRPLGSYLSGAMADRYGRRRALMLTLVLMGSGTALIAACPTFQSIGLLAPALVIFGRVLQGFSMGGEAGISSTWLMEQARPGQRCYWISWQLASQGGAILAGAAMATALNLLLSQEQMARWGWRVAFLPALLIVPLLLRLRRDLPETYVAPERGQPLARELFGQYWPTLLRGVLLFVGGTVFLQINAHYVPIHLARSLGHPRALSYLVSMAIGAGILLTAPLFGRMCDRVRRPRRVLACTLGGSMLAIVPVFMLLNTATSPALSMLLLSALMIFHTAGASAGFVMLLEQFPAHLRATAMALVYSTTVTVFGSTTVLAVAWLVETTGHRLVPAGYAATACAISLIALSGLRPPRQA